MGELATKLRALALRVDKIESDLLEFCDEQHEELEDALSAFETDLGNAEEELEAKMSEEEEEEDSSED